MAKKYETHKEVCAEMRSFGDVPPPRFAWRDLADRAEAAYNRGILVERNLANGLILSLQDKIDARCAEIKKLKIIGAKLIEELTRGANSFCGACKHSRGRNCENGCSIYAVEQLIKEAREVMV